MKPFPFTKQPDAMDCGPAFAFLFSLINEQKNGKK
jgi:hypothetical protein